MQHAEFFDVGNGRYVTRGEALRAFIAAIYNTAYVQAHFTTDDVFPRVQSDDCPEGYNALRKATAKSKLIAVALRKVARKGDITPTTRVISGDSACHRRPKTVWLSHVQRA